jgi:hypothetical protein
MSAVTNSALRTAMRWIFGGHLVDSIRASPQDAMLSSLD